MESVRSTLEDGAGAVYPPSPMVAAPLDPEGVQEDRARPAVRKEMRVRVTSIGFMD